MPSKAVTVQTLLTVAQTLLTANSVTSSPTFKVPVNVNQVTITLNILLTDLLSLTNKTLSLVLLKQVGQGFVEEAAIQWVSDSLINVNPVLILQTDGSAGLTCKVQLEVGLALTAGLTVTAQ